MQDSKMNHDTMTRNVETTTTPDTSLDPENTSASVHKASPVHEAHTWLWYYLARRNPCRESTTLAATSLG